MSRTYLCLALLRLLSRRSCSGILSYNFCCCVLSLSIIIDQKKKELQKLPLTYHTHGTIDRFAHRRREGNEGRFDCAEIWTVCARINVDYLRGYFIRAFHENRRTTGINNFSHRGEKVTREPVTSVSMARHMFLFCRVDDGFGGAGRGSCVCFCRREMVFAFPLLGLIGFIDNARIASRKSIGRIGSVTSDRKKRKSKTRNLFSLSRIS